MRLNHRRHKSQELYKSERRKPVSVMSIYGQKDRNRPTKIVTVKTHQKIKEKEQYPKGG